MSLSKQRRSRFDYARRSFRPTNADSCRPRKRRYSNVTSKKTYVLAGSVIGGTVGFLCFTDPGRKTVRALRRFDLNTIPEKAGRLHEIVDRRSKEVSRRLETARGRILDSIETGRRASEEADMRYHYDFQRVESKHNEVAANFHRTIDEVNRSMIAFEKSVASAVCQIGSMARAVQQGLRRLANPREAA